MYSYTPKIILVKTIFAGEPSIPSDVVCYDCTMRSWRRQGDSDGGKDNVWLHTQASLRVTVVFSTKKRRELFPGPPPLLHTLPAPSRHARCRPYIASGPAQRPQTQAFFRSQAPGTLQAPRCTKRPPPFAATPCCVQHPTSNQGHRARPLGACITSRSAQEKNKSHPAFSASKRPRHSRPSRTTSRQQHTPHTK